jgi:hypothetical protein
MISVICAVRDSKAEAFMQPFFAPTTAFAVRSFSDTVNKSGNPISDHPEDHDLYEVAAFDDSTGVVTSLDSPRHLVHAVSLLQQ